MISFDATYSDSHPFSENLRTTFIANNGVEKLIKGLDHSDKNIRKTTFDYVKRYSVDSMYF